MLEYINNILQKIAFNADPVAFSVFGVAIYWYAISYIVGILLACFYLKRIDRKFYPIKEDAFYDSLLLYMICGIVIGGRLGYILFYNPLYYFHNPIEMIMLRKGGMSFHGGIIGVVVATYLLVKRYKVSFWQVADIISVVSPIGLFFGRIANFINGELYGRPTDYPIGIIFPASGDNIHRHPSQIYEAILEGIVLFIIMQILLRFKSIRDKTGALSAAFLGLYALFRFIIEFFREPDTWSGLFWETISIGQIFSIAMIIIALIILQLRISKT